MFVLKNCFLAVRRKKSTIDSRILSRFKPFDFLFDYC